MHATQEEILEKYRKLPKEVRDVIFADNTSDKMFELGHKYNLHVDKIGALADEVGDLILGFSHPKDFVNNLTSALGLKAEDARKIAQDVNNDILVPIHDHLLTIHNMQESEKISFADGPGMSIGTPTPSDSPQNKSASVIPASFDDLKIELQRTIEREGGSTPNLKSVPIQTVATTPLTQPKPTYKSVDPYREAPEETPSIEKNMRSPLSASQNTKPTPVSPSKFSFGSPRKDIPEKTSEPMPTPTPYRSGVFQKKPQNSPFEEMQRRESKPKPLPQTPVPATSTAETPAKGHVTTPGGFRGFRMSEGGNLAHLREQTSEAAPYTLPKNTSIPAPAVRIPVVAPTPTEQDIAKKEAVKPISQQSNGSDPYREPIS